MAVAPAAAAFTLGDAAAVGSLLSSAGSLGGLFGGGGGSAKRAAAAAARTAADMQARSERQARADLAPYRVGGGAAQTRLSELMGLDAYDRDAIADELRKSNPALFAEVHVPESRARLAGSTNHRLYGDGTEYLINGEWVSGTEEAQQGYTDAQNKAIDDAIAAKKLSPDYGELTKEFTLADYIEDPGYQFRLAEGNKALERANSRRGNFYSGAALKAADAYNSGQASQEYQSAYDRFNQNKNTLYNRLAGISNTGLGAANTGVQVGQNSANAYNNIYGALGSANIAASTKSAQNNNQSIAGLLGGGLSSYGNNAGQSGLPWQTFGNRNPLGGFYTGA
jgi:uncharacterized protein YukE